jgi:hypothetical protein
MVLLKSQRNDILQAIKTSGLDPADFQRVEGDHEALFTFSPSRDYFGISAVTGRGYWARYTIAQTAEREYGPAVWGSIVGTAQQWLSEVKEEHETPDLWRALESQPSVAVPTPTTGIDEGDNSPFSDDERAHIAAQLQSILRKMEGAGALTAAEIRSLEGKLRYLEEASGRLGRIDWRTALMGVFLTAIVDAVLPPETTREILVMLISSLGHLFGGSHILGLPPAGI